MQAYCQKCKLLEHHHHYHKAQSCEHMKCIQHLFFFPPLVHLFSPYWQQTVQTPTPIEEYLHIYRVISCCSNELGHPSPRETELSPMKTLTCEERFHQTSHLTFICQAFSPSRWKTLSWTSLSSTSMWYCEAFHYDFTCRV